MQLLQISEYSNRIFQKAIDFFVIIEYTISAGRDALYTYDTELAFKRYVISSVIGSRLRAAFFVEEF